MRILVVANETLVGEALHEAVRHASARAGTQVHVVCPALNSRLRHYVSDTAAAREAAQGRLDLTLQRLASAGIQATGEVGDGDPLLAIQDALRTGGADELIISTHPESRSNWLERGVVETARRRFGLPTTHVVVDLGQEQARAGPETVDA